MAPSRPRILLIGAGRFGIEHLKEWQRLEALGEAELAGVVTGHADTRLAAIASCGVRVYPELLDAVVAGVDAVDIVTPAATHADLVRRCLPLAHVFVEKPLATTVADASVLTSLAAETGRVLMVGHLFRFHPVVRALKSLVEQVAERPRGIEGRLINPGAERREGDDVNLELLHLFDIVDCLFGVEPEVAVGRRRGSLNHVSLRYPGPMNAVFQLGWEGDRRVRTLLLTYPDRRVIADLVDNALVVAGRNTRLHKRFFPHRPQALFDQLRAFAGVVANPAASYPDAALGARIVRIGVASAPATGPDRPRIAVIGGGVFGATCAIELSAVGDVTLFERHAELMTEASALNQWRHHSGFHYPRSYDTMVEIGAARREFESKYEEAIDRRFPAYYCTSATGVEIPAERYLAACTSNRLRFTIEAPPEGVVDSARVSLCLKTDEAVYDVPLLRQIIAQRLGGNPRVCCRFRTAVVDAAIGASGVKRLTVTGPDGTHDETFDYVVNATYRERNRVAGWLGLPVEPLRFDLCEILSLRLPIRGLSVTILDGPFTSLIRIGPGKRFLLSHIDDTVSQSVIAEDGLLPEWQPRCSNRDNMLRHAAEYLPVLEHASDVESRWVTKALGAYARDFDSRPTVVTDHGFGCWSVLGGKIITCVSNAREIVRLIAAEQGVAEELHER